MGKEEFKEYYKKEDVTSTYDTQREGTKYRKAKRKRELQIFLDLLNKKDEDNVLELGCSSGFLTQHLGKVTAIDTSKEMLKITKQKNPQAKVLEADMFKLPFEDNSFNKVVIIRVWGHLSRIELKDALKEARRVLQKEGILVFDLEEFSILRIIINFFYKKFFRIKGYKNYRWSIKEATKILNEEGFIVDEIRFLKHKIGRQFVMRGKKISTQNRENYIVEVLNQIK